MSEGAAGELAGAFARAQHRTARPGARSRPRAEGAERRWAGTGPRAGARPGDAGAPRSLVLAGETLVAPAGFPRGPKRDGAGPARWGPGAVVRGAGPAAAKGRRGGAKRAHPGSSRPYGRPQSARPAEVAEVQGGGAAGERWRRAGGGGRAPGPGRRMVGNRSKLPGVTLLRRCQRGPRWGLQGPTPRPFPVLVASEPRRMMVGLLGFYFLLALELVLPSFDRHSWPIRS